MGLGSSWVGGRVRVVVRVRVTVRARVRVRARVSVTFRLALRALAFAFATEVAGVLKRRCGARDPFRTPNLLMSAQVVLQREGSLFERRAF